MSKLATLNEWLHEIQSNLKSVNEKDRAKKGRDDAFTQQLMAKDPDVVEKMEKLLKEVHTKATIQRFNMPVLDQ